jgi:membrane-associated protein
MTLLNGVHGPALLGVLCLLIFVEECGVPLPLAPGDLLLAACGLAIRRGGLNPVAAIVAVYVATLAGAATGRELFDAGGGWVVRRLSGRLGLSGPLDRAGRLLQRGGWPAVMVARLTPGMRVTTTQVAGILGLRRRTFLLGLAPGAAIYVGVFVGVGVVLGQPAVNLLQQVVAQLGLGTTVVLVVLLSIGAGWLAVRLLDRRELRRARDRRA